MSVRYDTIESLDVVLSGAGLEIAPMPKEALFLAARAFVLYWRSAGMKSGVLPDFFIGANAAINRWRLLTRDVGRYRTYFPTVELISPGVA